MKPNIRILVVYGVLVAVMVAVTVFETHKEHLYDSSGTSPAAFRAPKMWRYPASGQDGTAAGTATLGFKNNQDVKSNVRNRGGDYIKYEYSKNETEIIIDFPDVGNDGNALDNSIDYLRDGDYRRESDDSTTREVQIDVSSKNSSGRTESGDSTTREVQIDVSSNNRSGRTESGDSTTREVQIDLSSKNRSGRTESENIRRNSLSSELTHDSGPPPEYVEFMPREFMKPEEGLDMYHPPLKKILVWVEGYGSKTMSFGYGRAPFVRAGCEVDTCLVTANRSLVPFKEFQALIFHFRAMVPDELPKYKYPHQYWVFWEVESASYVYQDPGRYNGLFNLTMTYRRDSDVLAAYGRVYPLPPLAASPSPAEPRNYAAGKSKMAVWFVSNCHTHSRREKLVAAMQKFIKIDTIGHCGRLSCSRNNTHHCYSLMARHYKFYLSFENSLCRDYVTEKLFSVLKYDVVPVVLGLADYSQVAPPDSYINALRFPSVEHLVRHLQYLDANDTAYNQYFRWKSHYRVDNGWSSTARGFCDLCRRLHQEPQEPQVYQDMKHWFLERGGCKKLNTRAWTTWLW